MGCFGGSRRRRVVPKAKRVPVGQLPDDPAEKVELEYLTPMLLIPFLFFVQLGRIPKSTKAWREEARSKGWLVEYRREDGKIVIFISQTWWDREYLDPDRDPNDKYDVGGPDWQSGEKKNLKWRIIVAGVRRLIEEKGLEAADVMLWMDWPCIYQARPRPAAPPPRPAHPRPRAAPPQDDKEEKLKGVKSLIKCAQPAAPSMHPARPAPNTMLAGTPQSPTLCSCRSRRRS